MDNKILKFFLLRTLSMFRFIAITLFVFSLSITRALAAPASITYTFGHHLFTIPVSLHPEWRTPKEQWFFHGVQALPPARFLTCGKETKIEDGWTRTQTDAWNEEAIVATIDRVVAAKLNRDGGSVIIQRTGSGQVTFSGQGLTSRTVDLSLAARLTKTALENDIDVVQLPVIEGQPHITVMDSTLRSMGIKEVVMIGESVFAASPVNRRHNIGVGVERFNGHIIPQGSVFSFDRVLGPVNEKTGYWKELIIQGDTTLPDYGGGLCQVSSTAYRGPWEYGLPILQRKNHSYAVSYYSPQGTDATIFPPNVDMKFLNNTPGALLIQTILDPQDHVFFIYYGTKDDRATEIFGPYITDRKEAPKEERVVYTADIPVGERRKAGERHDGMNVLWYRRIERGNSGATLEHFFSSYEARPLTFQVGVRAEDMAKQTPSALSEPPSWLPVKH